MEELPKPVTLPQRKKHCDINQVPEVFQPRTKALNEKHVNGLIRAMQNNGGVLDPVVILQLGDHSFLIEGHHRMEAYKRAGVTNGIPVEYFNGSVKDALLASTDANSKVKLSMSETERLDRAWELVRFDLHAGDKPGAWYSIEQIKRSASVASRTVSNMRKVAKVLGDDFDLYESWQEANDVARGKAKRDYTEEEIEAMKEAQATDWSDQMFGTFATKLSNNTEIAAMALDMYFGRKLPELVRELEGFLPEEDCDLEEGDDF